MLAATMERVEQVSDVLDVPAKKTQREYRSRKGALVWCFGKSRDNWKAKYSEVKAQLDASQRKRRRNHRWRWAVAKRESNNS